MMIQRLSSFHALFGIGPGPAPKTDDAPKPGARPAAPGPAPTGEPGDGGAPKQVIDPKGTAATHFGGAAAGTTGGGLGLNQSPISANYQTKGPATQGYYSLGFGDSGLEIDSFGRVMLDPGQLDTTGLEHAGYSWLGETGYLGLPTEMKPGALAAGDYTLPGGDVLAVWKDGTLLVEPHTYDGLDALEAAGFQWEGETGMMSVPTQAGSHELPGGATLHIFDGMEPMVDPGDTPADGLESQGLSWAGETGYLSLPKSAEAHAAAGQYPLPGGFSLLARDGGDVFLDPGANDAAPLIAQGFKLVAVDKRPVLAFPGQ